MPREGHDKQIVDKWTATHWISIHVPREGHDAKPRPARGAKNISIHVPREGHDRLCVWQQLRLCISIHVPREGHDHNIDAEARELVTFQSTCPARGTTAQKNRQHETVCISIHVPREGHDSKHAQFFRADLRKSYKYPAERDALPTKNVCKHIKTLG